jgi:hypothetical protein
VHDDDVMEIVDTVPAHQHPDGLATLVHVRLRERENHATRIDARPRRPKTSPWSS